MSFLIIASFFAFGAIIASFAGVVAARFNTGQSFLAGRSRCDACNSPLAALTLVPIVSYFFSRARSACCGARVSALSTLAELLLGVLFVLSYLKIGLTTELPFAFISLSLLLVLVLYDLAHKILPSGFLFAFVVSSAITGFLSAPSLAVFSDTFLVALAIASSLALIHFFSRGRAMGFSDAPLAFGLAILVGKAALSGFIFSFWIGAVIGIAVLAHRPRGSRMGVEVPFAPFLAAGFLIAHFTQWNPFALIL